MITARQPVAEHLKNEITRIKDPFLQHWQAYPDFQKIAQEVYDGLQTDSLVSITQGASVDAIQVYFRQVRLGFKGKCAAVSTQAFRGEFEQGFLLILKLHEAQIIHAFIRGTPLEEQKETVAVDSVVIDPLLLAKRAVDSQGALFAGPSEEEKEKYTKNITIFNEKAKLFNQKYRAHGDHKPTELADFNSLKEKIAYLLKEEEFCKLLEENKALVDEYQSLQTKQPVQTWINQLKEKKIEPILGWDAFPEIVAKQRVVEAFQDRIARKEQEFADALQPPKKLAVMYLNTDLLMSLQGEIKKYREQELQTQSFSLPFFLRAFRYVSHPAVQGTLVLAEDSMRKVVEELKPYLRQEKRQAQASEELASLDETQQEQEKELSQLKEKISAEFERLSGKKEAERLATIQTLEETLLPLEGALTVPDTIPIDLAERRTNLKKQWGLLVTQYGEETVKPEAQALVGTGAALPDGLLAPLYIPTSSNLFSTPPPSPLTTPFSGAASSVPRLAPTQQPWYQRWYNTYNSLNPFVKALIWGGVAVTSALVAMTIAGFFFEVTLIMTVIAGACAVTAGTGMGAFAQRSSVEEGPPTLTCTPPSSSRAIFESIGNGVSRAGQEAPAQPHSSAHPPVAWWRRIFCCASQQPDGAATTAIVEKRKSLDRA